MERALNLGMEQTFVIHTPLMRQTKAQTWAMAKALGGDALVDIIVEHSHTCYLGERETRHDWGFGCGDCPACELRAKGWAEWVADGRAGARGMTYSVKEIFLTLQGEGGQAGRAAVFCRFAGCNLWSGREQDRASAVCTFCDTDFVGTDGEGGGKFATPEALAARWRPPWTGRAGEPAGGLHRRRAPAPARSAADRRPARAGLRDRGRDQRHPPRPRRHRLDLRQPQGRRAARPDLRPGAEAGLSPGGRRPGALRGLAFERFFLQPMDGPDREAATAAAVAYCLAHPRWRLSVQTHKYLGLP